MVANIISAMVKDSHFPGALKEKIGTSVDAAEMEKRKDGCWIKNIVFNFPVPVNGEEVKELPLENGMMLETVAHLGITLVNKENCIGIELYISDDKSILTAFMQKRILLRKN